jgi:hypothetical protein
MIINEIIIRSEQDCTCPFVSTLVDVAINLAEQPFVYRLVNCYSLAQPTKDVLD